MQRGSVGVTEYKPRLLEAWPVGGDYFIKRGLLQVSFLPNRLDDQQLIVTGMVFMFHNELETLYRDNGGDGD